MRIVPLVVLALALALFSPTAHAQQTAQPLPQRDPQAVAALNQMAAATGWNLGNLPLDAVASGTVTRNRGETQGTASVTIKVKGYRLARTEVQDSHGLRTTIVNGGAAAVVTSEGAQFIPAHAAFSMRPKALPFLPYLAAVNDSTASLRYLGTENVSGELAHRIEIAPPVTANDPLTELRQRAARLIVWISAITSLPLQIETSRVAMDNPTATRAVIRTLSDYRVVNGLAIPFHQEEHAGDALLYSIQLTQLQFNVGLTDADFALPATQP